MPARLQPRPVRLVLPPGRPVAAALLVHSWWGATPSCDAYAARLQANGIASGISDLFDGHLASSETEARNLRRAPRAEPMYRSLQRDLRDLRAAAGIDRAAVIGFSMGAHWAVWLSQQDGNPIRRVVLYYGARGGDFTHSRADYLAHFAESDPWVTASARRGMERALNRAGRPYTAHDYPGTGHWFAEAAQTGSYDPVAADLALDRTLGFLA